MAINAYFFDSTDTDPRTYSAADFAAAFGIILQNGIVPSSTDGALGLGWHTNYTAIGAGRAVVQGHFVNVTAPETITIIGGTYTGMVVLRVDIADARKASIIVRTDQNPQQDSAAWELPLFTVTVSNGVITGITDLRVQGGAVAKTAANVPTYFYRDNGVYLQIGDYSLALTPAQPPASAKRVWIQID